jgi:hypothetical protein
VPAQAKPIVLGETQRHFICPARDADWLTFSATVGKAYSIEVSSLNSEANIYLNLFGPDGRTLIPAGNSVPGANGTARVIFYPEVDGWYYVQAKNEGDIGYAGLQYSISLSDVSTPTGTPTNTPTSLPTGTPSNTPVPATQAPESEEGADLLHPQKGDGGVDVFTAGPADGMSADALEANDAREEARAVNVGAVYKYLNFVTLLPDVTDADFFTFDAKPGLCYLVQTGDLSSGLDTTILLWQPVATEDKWKLLAQNDDAHPHTADLSSSVRWCAAGDTELVMEVRNYGGPVATSAWGKSYSLSVLVDPPTPTPAPPSATAAPAIQQSALAQVQAQQAAAPPGVPASTPAAPTAEPTLTQQGTLVSLEATPTATPLTMSVDIVAYVADRSATGPNPGDGIVDLPVLLVDVRTNAVVLTANTDPNGHARLEWQWRGPVRVALPSFGWGRTLQLTDFSTADESLGEHSLLLQARMSSYLLPGIYP